MHRSLLSVLTLCVWTANSQFYGKNISPIYKHPNLFLFYKNKIKKLCNQLLNSFCNQWKSFCNFVYFNLNTVYRHFEKYNFYYLKVRVIIFIID